MSKIAIIYFSKTDVTGQLARAIAAGVNNKALSSKVNVKSSLTELKAVRLLRDVL